MRFLLKFSGVVDALNERIGRATTWLVLIVTLISAINAVVRKTFDMSSNALLEIQWYLFSAIFLLCAGYALLKNAHVRIDVVVGRFSPRVQAWVDIVGTLLFLLPISGVVLWLSWGVFVTAYNSGEVSNNAGGLILWPARLLVPIGFALLMLQGLSEMVKRIAFLRGYIDQPWAEGNADPEAELAEEIRRSRNLQGAAE